MKRTAVNVGQSAGKYTISHAIKVGDLVYASGRSGRDPVTNDLPADIRAQTRNALDKLSAVFEAAGTSLKRAVKLTVFLVDMNDFDAYNEVYRTYFDDEPPARVTVQVSGLYGGVRIEIDAVAVLP